MCVPRQPLFLNNALAAALETPFEKVRRTLDPTLQHWGNGYLKRISPSGSYAKGTSVEGSSDVDLFLSVSSTANESLAVIFDKLERALISAGYHTRRQNVSIAIKAANYKVDLTPGKRRDAYGNDHSLYSTKTGTWIKTDIDKQIAFVRGSQRQEEIKILKRWRHARSIDWPSFHLELYVIASLRGQMIGNHLANAEYVIREIAKNGIDRPLIDPANTNNNLSDHLAPLTDLTARIAAENFLAK